MHPAPFPGRPRNRTALEPNRGNQGLHGTAKNLTETGNARTGTVGKPETLEPEPRTICRSGCWFGVWFWECFPSRLPAATCLQRPASSHLPPCLAPPASATCLQPLTTCSHLFPATCLQLQPRASRHLPSLQVQLHHQVDKEPHRTANRTGTLPLRTETNRMEPGTSCFSCEIIPFPLTVTSTYITIAIFQLTLFGGRFYIFR